MSGVEGVRSYDEVAFNNTLSSHFERHEDDHALIRWLVEESFLKPKPASTRSDLGLYEIIVEDLPLHISSNWAAHGRDGLERWAQPLDCYVIGYEENTLVAVR